MARLMKAFAALVLLGVVLPVMADPVTLVIVAAQAAGAFGVISTVTALAITLGANLISAADKRRQASAASDAALAAYNASLQDRNVTVLRNDSPWQIVYGNPAPVGGTMVAILSSGTADQFKHMVVVFAAHECAGIDEVYIEGDPLGTLDGSGWVTGGAFMDSGTARVNCQKHLSPGGVDTADAFLIAAAPSNWTTAHKLSGYTYIVLTIDLNMSRFQGGPPNVTAKLRGKKIYDYRTSTTIYSTNPALCVADFLTSVYGYSAASGQIDTTAAIAAANACDTQGFNCHGALSTDASRDTNLHALEDSMAGRTHWSGGVWRIIAGIWATPVMTLTDAYLAAPIEVTQAGNPRTGRYNSVRGKYVPAAQLGVTVDFTPYVVSSYVTADGPNQWLDASYGFTASNSECQKLAAIAVERSRAGLTINYPAHLTAWKLQPGDRVYVTNAELGFAAKTFRVVDWTHINNAPLGLVLTEDTASMYTGTFSVSDPLAATSNLANPYARPVAPLSLAANSGTGYLAVLGDGTIQTRVYCTWSATTQRAVLQGGYAQIQWKLTSDPDANYANTDLPPDSTSALLTGPKDGTNITIRARFITGVGSYGAWSTISHTVIGKTAPPGDCSAFSYSIEVTGIRLAWTGVTDSDLQGYEVRLGGSNWATASFLAFTKDVGYLFKAQVIGTYALWVKAKDTTGNYSTNAASLSAVVGGPGAPSPSYQVTGVSEYLSWTIPTSGFQIDRYEIRYGASWAAGTYLDTTKATGYIRKVDYSGARTYWIAAIDTVGNYGTPGSVSATLTIPGPVTSLRADVIDNNALLYWNAPSTGSLPVDRYEVRKGATWAGGTVIGSNGNSTFTTVFEQLAGTYIYWVAPIDSAGTYGTAVSVSAYINQPPDYVLRANINSVFGGVKVNATPFGTGLVLPVNTTETWTQHFVNNGYATPQAQITAGYPLYIEPSLTTASYTEAIDYGTTLPATNITATLNSTVLAGTVGISCQIQWSNTSAAGPWTNATAGATSAVASNFRWVQVVYTFTATGGTNLLQITGLNVKLSVKQRNDSGSGTAAIGGTAVTFGYAFISADCPIVQPSFTSGAAPRYAVVTYAGGVNPTGFTVQIFNSAGTDVGGAFSWTVRGF